MPEYSTILFEVRDKVAHLTINRPEAANALNAEVARQLDQAALRCDEDANVRAVLMTGAVDMLSTQTLTYFFLAG